MPTDVETLMEMGFGEHRAKRALAKTGYKGVQVAMDWCFAHDEDPGVDDPFEEPKGYSLTAETPTTEKPAEASGSAAGNEGEGQSDNKAAEGDGQPAEGGEQTAKSLKCDDCGKVFRNMEAAEFHAVKSGHSNFSESTEEKKPLTAEEKAAQMDKLQEKMKQKRIEREESEKQERIQREKLRRKHGQEMVNAKAKFEEDEIKRIAEMRRREKEEDKLARQKIKEQIERDKKERAAKFPKQSQTGGEAASPQPTQQKPAATPTPPKDYTQARIQVRLPSGQALTQTFGAKEELAAVRLFIEMNRKDGDNSPFKLMISFPRKVFTEEDMQKPLSELGLVPSAVLIVSKAT